MLVTIRLVSTSFTSHNYHVVAMVRTLRLYSLSNFLELYNFYCTILLTIVTVLWSHIPDHIHSWSHTYTQTPAGPYTPIQTFTHWPMDMWTHTLTLGHVSTHFPTQAYSHPLPGHTYYNTLTHILYDTPSCTLVPHSCKYTCTLISIHSHTRAHRYQPAHSLATHSPRSLAWHSCTHVTRWLLTHSLWAQIQTHKQPHSHPLTSIAPTPTFFHEVH